MKRAVGKVISGTVGTVAVLSICRFVMGGVELSGEEKLAYLQRVVAEQGKVRQVWLKVHTERLEGPELIQRTLEWAKSTDGKMYTKQFDFTPVGKGESGEYGIGVFDGKKTSLYSSSGNNGSLRSGFDRHKEERLIYLMPAECVNLFGNSEGTIGELFKPLGTQDWRAEVSENRETLTLTMLQGSRQAWTFDLTKGCVLKEYASDVPGEGGGWQRFSTLSVREVKEVAPGIWLPWACEAVTRFKEGEEWVTLRTKRVVLEARVNTPEIEAYFSFRWPRGAAYYDYDLRRDVRTRGE